MNSFFTDSNSVHTFTENHQEEKETTAIENYQCFELFKCTKLIVQPISPICFLIDPSQDEIVWSCSESIFIQKSFDQEKLASNVIGSKRPPKELQFVQ